MATNTTNIGHNPVPNNEQNLDTILCPNPCRYYDQDGVICNEEPWNCPINQLNQEHYPLEPKPNPAKKDEKT